MSVGLDLGIQQFRSLRRQGERLIARSCPPVYAVVLDNPARRALFHDRGVPFAQFGKDLILFGDTADEWATRLRVSTIPLYVNGRLHFDDAVIRQVTSALIEGLLPVPDGGQTECCLTLPGTMLNRDDSAVTYLSQVVRQFGYQPRFSSASLAVALSELSPWGVNGIGLHLGELRCGLSIVRHGRELMQWEFARGLASPGDESATDQRLRELFATAAFELNRRPEWKALPMPVALAISGEGLTDPALAEHVASCVQHASWPFALGAARIATEPAWTVSRGCLIQAELEQLTTLARSAA